MESSVKIATPICRSEYTLGFYYEVCDLDGDGLYRPVFRENCRLAFANTVSIHACLPRFPRIKVRNPHFVHRDASKLVEVVIKNYWNSRKSKKVVSDFFRQELRAKQVISNTHHVISTAGDSMMNPHGLLSIDDINQIKSKIPETSFRRPSGNDSLLVAMLSPSSLIDKSWSESKNEEALVAIRRIKIPGLNTSAMIFFAIWTFKVSMILKNTEHLMSRDDCEKLLDSHLLLLKNHHDNNEEKHRPRKTIVRRKQSTENTSEEHSIHVLPIRTNYLQDEKFKESCITLQNERIEFIKSYRLKSHAESDSLSVSSTTNWMDPSYLHPTGLDWYIFYEESLAEDANWKKKYKLELIHI